jgi:hypothetical protein
MTGAGESKSSVTPKALEASEIVSDTSKFFLEVFPPESGEKRTAWLHRFSLAVGIRAARLRDLFYDRRCEMTAVELATFQRKWGVLIEGQIIALQRQQDALEARIRGIGERHEERNPHRRRMGAARHRLDIRHRRVSLQASRPRPR